MTNHKPTFRWHKVALVAPLSIAAVVFVIIVIGLRSEFRDKKPVQPPPAPTPAPPAAPPAPPPLDRPALLDEASIAAADYAAGTPPGPGAASDLGRRFVLRLPFGCGGPQVTSAISQASAEYDAEHQAVRLTVSSANWTTLPLIQALPNADKIEAVEGFWIPRPWLRTEACPPERSDLQPATPTPATAPTLGLAQVFGPDASRALRRNDRPYAFVRKIAPTKPELLNHAYRLVLEGRITGFGDGQALHCWSESPDHRPICIYAVSLDRVALEDAVDGEQLAEWRE